MQKSQKPSRLSHLGQSTHNNHTLVDDMGEMLATRYVHISAYLVLMLLLAVAIVWTAVRTAGQVQQYHQDYRSLQDMKAQYHKLQIEHQRLLIEQQTFSATPQIASRAVVELGMYSPTSNDKWIIQPSVPPVTEQNLLPSTNSALTVNTQEEVQ